MLNINSFKSRIIIMVLVFLAGLCQSFFLTELFEYIAIRDISFHKLAYIGNIVFIITVLYYYVLWVLVTGLIHIFISIFYDTDTKYIDYLFSCGLGFSIIFIGNLIALITLRHNIKTIGDYIIMHNHVTQSDLMNNFPFIKYLYYLNGSISLIVVLFCIIQAKFKYKIAYTKAFYAVFLPVAFVWIITKIFDLFIC